MIPGPAGRLEAIFEWEPQFHFKGVALVCHPHPLYGGTLHNKLVFRAAKAALQAGLPALRFNFRGVGRSQGTHAYGVGERDDVRAAVDYLAGRFPQLPVYLMGFSFGAWVGLAAGTYDPRVAGLVGLGIPTIASDMAYLCEAHKPKLIVQGTEDEFGLREEVEALFDSLPEPKRLHWVRGADHFFTAKLGEVQAAIREYLQGIITSA
jgi:alpha/beta superfamily hydrolase